MHDERPVDGRPGVETHHRRVIPQRDDAGAAARALVGERRAPDRALGIPGEAIGDHAAGFHLAARAELGKQPGVGHREVGIRDACDAAHADLRLVARRGFAVARGEV
jgi:hypothetical protein